MVHLCVYKPPIIQQGPHSVPGRHTVNMKLYLGILYIIFQISIIYIYTQRWTMCPFEVSNFSGKEPVVNLQIILPRENNISWRTCHPRLWQGSSGRSGVLRCTETHEILPGEHGSMVANHRTKPLVLWAFYHMFNCLGNI